MAATLSPQVDAVQTPPEREAMPIVNPITVSMALAVLFLVVLLAIVTVRPTSAHERQGADEGRPAATARHAAVFGPE